MPSLRRLSMGGRVRTRYNMPGMSSVVNTTRLSEASSRLRCSFGMPIMLRVRHRALNGFDASILTPCG